MIRLILIFSAFSSYSICLADQPYGQFNQNYTYNSNMQYGATNWYSSPLGIGAAQIGTVIANGLVNKMMQPDVVILQNTNSYIPAPSVNYRLAAPSGCHTELLRDSIGIEHAVNVCY